MVVAQLVGQSIPTPEIRGSNPVVGNFFTNKYIEKTKMAMPQRFLKITTAAS